MRVTIKILIIMSFLLTSCSSDNNDGSLILRLNPLIKKDSTTTTRESKIASLITKEDACNLILPVEKLKQSFNVKTEVKACSSGNNVLYCDFSLNENGNENHEDKNRSFQIEPIVYKPSFRVTFKNSKKNAKTYIPIAKNEEEIQKEIANALELVTSLLKYEKKSLKASEAKDLEKMLRKYNHIIEVKNLGDAAYWKDATGGTLSGSLRVLDGNIEIIVYIKKLNNIVKEDMETAIEIAKLILD